MTTEFIYLFKILVIGISLFAITISFIAYLDEKEDDNENDPRCFDDTDYR